MIFTRRIFLPLLVLLLSGATGLGGISPVGLTCESMEAPAIVDVRQPRLGWVNVADDAAERGQIQTAYQIRVASSPGGLESPDLWDSGKVDSSQSDRVEYAGKPLSSRMDCWWQVRVWDRDDAASAWSEPATWRMGILAADEWKAQWIGAPWQGEEALPKPDSPKAKLPEQLPPPAPMLRTEFTVEKEISKAVAFVTGLGYFELFLNGEKVGDDVLVPNLTNYGQRPDMIKRGIPVPDHFERYKVMVLAYDVRDLLQPGANAVGALLGNGFYNPARHYAAGYGSPRFLLQLHLTYADGSEDVVVSDARWKAARSPILMDMVYYGEHYDARREQPGWNTPGFDDAAWEPVALRQPPGGELVAHTAYPDRVMERLAPLSIKKLENGNHLVDFGEEVSGWLRLNNVTAPPGHKIEIKYNSNIHSGDNSYTFKGGEPESYAARFNWFVFGSVEISNWPGELRPEMLTAEVVYTQVDQSAVFETSNPLFNDINKIWRRSLTDNMKGGLVTDCPHRERLGYTGDGQVACVTVMHNYDVRNFYYKWIQDIRDARNPDDGYVPNAAPWHPGAGGGPAWGAAICIMPWEYYLHYGAVDMLEDSFSGMKDYVRYMQSWVGDDGLMHMQRPGRDGEPLQWFNLGEWLTPGDLPPDPLVHTFYLWRCADITAQTARILGHDADADKYAALAGQASQAFHRHFYDEESGTYGKSGGNIFALRMGVPADRRQPVVAALRRDISANKGHLDTGIFGTQFFFEMLSENGMHDLAFAAMNKRTFPSYGQWLELGATTTRESWKQGGSHNHPMFGGGLVWFYRQLAGMQTDPGQPGYRHILFRPQPVEGLDWVRYSNRTVLGEAGIHWSQGKEGLAIAIEVPVGSTATVHVPLPAAGNITESGHPAADAPGVQFLKDEDGCRVFSVGSGRYAFLSN